MQSLVPHIVLFSVPAITSPDKHCLCSFICIVTSEDSSLSILTPLFPPHFCFWAVLPSTIWSWKVIPSISKFASFLCLTFNSIQVERCWGPFRLLCFTQMVLYCFRLRHSNWQCPIIWELFGFKYKVASSVFEGYFGGKALNLVFCDMCHLMWLPLAYPFGNNLDPSCSRGHGCPSSDPCFQHFVAQGGCQFRHLHSFTFLEKLIPRVGRKYQPPATYSQWLLRDKSPALLQISGKIRLRWAFYTGSPKFPVELRFTDNWNDSFVGSFFFPDSICHSLPVFPGVVSKINYLY